MDIEQKALLFAYQAHEGQVRKYTGDPYITHPISVAAIVKSVAHMPTMIAACLLHDVVEDTDTRLIDVAVEFGEDVAELVDALTDASTPDDGNREARKRIDREWIAKASPEAKTIKLADLIHNTQSIVLHDPKFAKVYMQEKRLLLEVLRDGDAELWNRATDIVQRYFKEA
ncbi:HD domain-containing protein [Frateuria aurantia]|uniref:Guanosine polyphosphate synthetase/pyrophosphohydrolase n=1 Tax=Frateuria aurantia (strain ATCC 33424 / DSM 6220 / KCTC 2777 / LMG 1558 / NBRC 3245 / NCIMB 13370) TaxID=767434 RepID=H8L5W8_FRAAD|nr:HD domain-containing protein [Frateuria aurantia]AFC85868.1 guanosine polyphosphate synthetase/pyrophosphohydrolase [Frateuria aurantia DSM 6220]